MSQTLGTAAVLVKAKTGQYKKDLKTAEARTRLFGQRATKSVNSVTASFATLAGVAGAGALATSLVKTGATFESQMSTVKGIMRASDADYNRLAEAAKKMGAETEWSATNSAKALEYMGLAGWSVQKSIAGLPGMLDAATAAGKDLGTVSDILTDSLTAMGLQIADIDRITDVMTGTTTRANTDFIQMGEALKEAAPYAKAYGYEIEEVAALIGVVADAGIKGSDAGTGLKNTWINNAKAAKELGTEATDLIGTLRAANKAQWDTNKFAEVYGKIAGKTVLNIAASIDKYEKLADTLHDVKGETKKLAETKLDNLVGDYKILKSVIEAVGNESYDSIKDGLRKDIQGLTEYVKNNKQHIVEFVGNLKKLSNDLVKIAAKIGRVFSTTVDGWNSLPTVIQELGIVGAIVGGVKAKAALLLITKAIGDIKELDRQAQKAGDMPKFKGLLSLAQNRLDRLKESYDGLRGNDVNAFGPGYLAQIAEAEKEVEGLKALIEATQMTARNPDDWRNMRDSIVGAYEEVKEIVNSNPVVDPLKVGGKKNKKDGGATKAAGVSKWAGWMGDVENLHAAEVRRMSDMQNNIDLQNRLAEAMEDTYSIDYGAVTDGLYELEEVAVETSSEMEDAFVGWANGYANTLNEMLWGSEVTFEEILKSFGKMITGMIIQQELIKPLVGSMTGDDGWISGGLGLLTGLFHDGGVVGSGEGGSRVVSPSVFAGAPRFHTGLLPDEFPAILQKNESVLTPEQMKVIAGSGGSYQINVPVSVSGGDNRLSQTLQTEVEKTVIKVMQKEMR